MRALVVATVSALLIASSLALVALPASADGSEIGVFPDRTFVIVRSPPGSPRTDAYAAAIPSDPPGTWRVILTSSTISSVVVEVYEMDAGIRTLLTASKLTRPGDKSSPVPTLPGHVYSADFTPYGKAKGEARLSEVVVLNRKPVVSFTYSPTDIVAGRDYVTFDASASYDPEGVPLSFQWDFGDGVTSGGEIASHRYETPGSYLVVLRASDGVTWSSTMTTATARLPREDEAALIVLRPDNPVPGESVYFNASLSFRYGHYPVVWSWDFSGGDSDSGPGVFRTYAEEGYHPASLTVTYEDGYIATASAAVPVFQVSLHFRYGDFFNVPYGEWWDMRTGIYGDRPAGAECFSQAGIADGYCTPTDAAIPDVASYPYVNVYLPPGVPPLEANPFLYAPYRMDVEGRNIPGYGLDRPLFLPTCKELAWTSRLNSQLTPWVCPPDAPEAGGYVDVSWSMDYMDVARERAIAMGTAPDDCPSLVDVNDGFVQESYVNVTLDAVASERLFGVTGDPTTWWAANTKEGCGSGGAFDIKSGPFEKALGQWFRIIANDPYDIFTTYEYPYTTLFLDVSWKVDSPSTGGWTRISVHQGSWGMEAFLSRLFHYGRTNYTDAIASGALPQGWWGAETPWMEDFRMTAHLGETAMDFSLSTAIMNHFSEQATPGSDGVWRTVDDQPVWTWAPRLSDLLYSTTWWPYSELDPYARYSYLHTTPGSPRYGTNFAYEYVPAVWGLAWGQDMVFFLPAGEVLFHDPFNTSHSGLPDAFVPILSPLTFSGSEPAGLGMWDEANRTLTVRGPQDFPNPPPPPDYVIQGEQTVFGQGAPLYVFARG